MLLSAKSALIAFSAVSALAMLYVGAYQIRAIEHMSCPLLKHGCEAVADAPFARPFGIPDGFIAAAMYGLLILLALLGSQMLWARYSLRTLAVLANVFGIFDMDRLGAYCFYCLLTYGPFARFAVDGAAGIGCLPPITATDRNTIGVWQQWLQHTREGLAAQALFQIMRPE
jgi:uncharacterized membrane protein